MSGEEQLGGKPEAVCENCHKPANGDLSGDAAQFRKNRLGRSEGVLVLCELCHECQTRRHEHTELVVSSTASHRLIVAGPGTGKTYTFSETIKGLPTGTRALVFTLTNNLARDLEMSLAGIPNREVAANTFHGYCKRLLHTRFDPAGLTHDFIYFSDLPSLIEADAQFLDLSYTRGSFHEAFANMDTGDKLRFYIDRGSYYDAASHDDAVWRVYDHLADAPGSVPEFDIVIADEFQDFNKLEASFIELLGAKNRILLAGDDDQALYGFRHASTEFIRQLFREDKRYESLSLPYCSRCTPAIVEATNAVVESARAAGLLSGRIPREYLWYWPDKYEEDERYPRIEVAECSARKTAIKFVETRILDLVSAEGTAGDGDAIAFMVIGPGRRPDLLRAIAEHLLAALDQDRFEIITKEESPTEINLLEGYRILREDENSNLGWRVVLAVDPVECVADVIRFSMETGEPLVSLLPEEYVERHLQSAGEETEETEEESATEEDIEEGDDQPRRIQVVVTNFLGSKGLAASHVVMVGMNNGTFPEVPSGIRDDEVCRFIVGLTRARRSCAVVTHKVFDRDRRITVGRPATFLKWLPEDRAELHRYRLVDGELTEIS